MLIVARLLDKHPFIFHELPCNLTNTQHKLQERLPLNLGSFCSSFTTSGVNTVSRKKMTEVFGLKQEEI